MNRSYSYLVTRALLLRYLNTHDQPRNRTVTALQHIARYVPEAELDQAITFTQQKFERDLHQQYILSAAIRNGMEQRGGHATPALQQWTVGLATQFLKELPEVTATWKCWLLEGTGKPVNPSVVDEQSAEGDLPAVRMISSGPRGTGLTGILHSPEFVLPPSLSLYVRDPDIRRDEKNELVSFHAVRVRLAENLRVLGGLLQNKAEHPAPAGAAGTHGRGAALGGGAAAADRESAGQIQSWGGYRSGRQKHFRAELQHVSSGQRHWQPDRAPAR